MKIVKARPKYKCDFCRHTSTKEAMFNHEKICFRNPNRFCELCKNKGFVREEYDDIPGAIYQDIPCYYCKDFYSKLTLSESE